MSISIFTLFAFAADAPFIKASAVLIRNNLVRTYFNPEDESRLEVANPTKKVAFTINYKNNKFAAMLRNVYFGEVSYVDASTTPVLNQQTGKNETLDQVFAAKVVTDLSISYQITPSFNVTVGANNLLDVYPDQQLHSENVSYGRFPYSRRVQQFGFNGAFYFGRLILIYVKSLIFNFLQRFKNRKRNVDAHVSLSVFKNKGKILRGRLNGINLF